METHIFRLLHLSQSDKNRVPVTTLSTFQKILPKRGP